MNQVRKSSQSGFTLVELSLAMAFIAMILLAIALLTIQISSIYNKGLTVRAVNEAGQLISRDMQRTLNTSVATEVTYVEQPNYGGRLCANGILYAWNYAGHLSNGFFGRNIVSGAGNVRMVRFVADRSYCELDGSGQYPMLPAATANSFSELLKEGDNTLALSDLSVDSDSVKDDDTQKIYSVSFIVGTDDVHRIDGNGCAVPESAIDDEYCAVNEFNFTARAGNRSSTGAGEGGE